MICQLCKSRLTFSGGFWRDETPDPGDGNGGDADCGEAIAEGRNDNRHYPVPDVEFRIIFEGVFDGPTAEIAVENARQQIQNPRFEPVLVEEETQT